MKPILTEQGKGEGEMVVYNILDLKGRGYHTLTTLM